MPTQKLHFEVIPVSIVKKIVEALPQEEKQREAQKESGSEWRDLAQQVQREADSDKMIHLVQRLIEKFDEEKLRKSQAAYRARDRAASRS